MVAECGGEVRVCVKRSWVGHYAEYALLSSLARKTKGQVVAGLLGPSADQLQLRLAQGYQQAVNVGGKVDVGDLRLVNVRNDPWPEAAGRIKILALGHVEFGVPHPVADGALVAQGDGGNVIERRALGDVPAGLADDQHQLALI